MSTENAAFSQTNSVEMHVGGIFCGLAKGFDCINHEILLAKLDFFDIWGVTADCHCICWWQ